MKIMISALTLAAAVAAATSPVVAAAAETQLQASSGSQVNGTVRFYADGERVRVLADVHGLTPGMHGFHVHERGNCSAPDASSAGGHFNPAGNAHGAHEAMVRHGGDLGNLRADANGDAYLDGSFEALSVEIDDERSVIGRAVIVHAAADDLKTQPTGNSGARVACGVIRQD